jgi:hypothetical protein
MNCDYRAAFDRAIAQGTMQLDPVIATAVEENKKSSPYADFGTCAHFHLQDGLRCVFPGNPADFAPEPEQKENAAKLYGGNADMTEAAIRACATLAATKMPVAPDGLPWLAESEWRWGRYCQGHIDFLSQDRSCMIDLKTTSRPPPHNRIKAEHLIQCCCYKILVDETPKDGEVVERVKTGGVLYVGRDSSWVLFVPIDFTSPAMQELVQHVRGYLRYLVSPNLFKFAVPRLGEHCSDGWCPYKGMCKDQFIPAAGSMQARVDAVPSLNIAGILP